MPRFLVALLAAVGVSLLGFAVAATIWDGGVPDGSALVYMIPLLGTISAMVLAVAGALTKGRLGRLLLAAAFASVAGGVAAGFMTAGVTASFGLGQATWFATSILGAGLLPGAAVFSRVYSSPVRPATTG